MNPEYLCMCVCVWTHACTCDACMKCHIVISPVFIYIYFSGHIGMTFQKKKPAPGMDIFSMRRFPEGPRPLSGLDPLDEEYVRSKWCYDTPGVVHPDQVCSDSARIWIWRKSMLYVGSYYSLGDWFVSHLLLCFPIFCLFAGDKASKRTSYLVILELCTNSICYIPPVFYAPWQK